MTRHLIMWTVVWLSTASPAIAQTQGPAAAVRKFTVSEPVLAGGAPLAPGTYEIRIVTAGGETTSGSTAQRAVEIVAGGKVVAREVAEIVAASETVGTSGNPSSVRVEKLKEGDFVRVSFVEGTDRYLIYLPTGK
jgi:hypothetical protein